MKLLCLLLCILCVNCFHIDTEPSIKEKVYGGLNAKISEAPYQAALEYEGLNCGAAILSKDSVALAVSCIEHNLDVVAKGKIRVGTDVRRHGGKIFSITNLMPYPGYKSAKPWINLALLQLNDSIIFNENIQEIIISDTDPKQDEQVTISGFGSDTNENEELSSTLNVANVTVLPESDCDNIFRGEKVSKVAFCTTKGANTEDIGGPVVMNGKLVGIISSTGEGRNANLITKVSLFAKWLRSMINLFHKKENH